MCGKTEKLKIGVIIPCRNEGPQIVDTVNDFRESLAERTAVSLVFAVLDDGSTDGCCAPLQNTPDVFLSRSETPQGEAFNRNIGAEQLIAWGADSLLWVDGHERTGMSEYHKASLMLPPDLSPEQRPVQMQTALDKIARGEGPAEKKDALLLLARAAIQTKGIVCSTVFSLNRPGEHDFPRNGAAVEWRPFAMPPGTDPNLPRGLRLHYLYTRNQILEPVPFLWGAGYCMTPNTFHNVGGWTDIKGLYGFAEEAICIRAWFLNIPCFNHTQANLRHFYRGPRPYPMSGLGYWQNFTWCLKTIFSDDTFRSVFLPLVVAVRDDAIRKREWAADVAQFVEQYEADPEAIRLRDEFQAQKKHTDEEALKWLGIVK